MSVSVYAQTLMAAAKLLNNCTVIVNFTLRKLYKCTAFTPHDNFPHSEMYAFQHSDENLPSLQLTIHS